MGTLRFLDACARRPVDVTPVWLMRQAGRYLPEYREIRERLSFIEMCKRPDVACEVTLQPLRRFDLDAAIVFADILLPLEPMGIGFRFAAEGGPVIDHPIRSGRDVKGVRAIDPRTELDYVMETLRLVRREIDGKTPLIGFAGAPYTLVSYVVEGGHPRDHAHVKSLMLSDQATFNGLMELLAEVVAGYLLAQIEAGAQAVQLFDSWVGRLAPFDYERFVLPHVRYVIDQVRGRGAPVIYFANGASGMLDLVGQTGADVYGVDWRIGIDRAWEQLGDVAVQGNLDPLTLLGPPAAIAEHVADVLRRAGGRPGHIFNLGHGLVPQTDPANVRHLVDTVHRLSAGARD
ncbi:MAG TPA: uroporphyrinogen decarboxylase [Thermoleophilia bacterium]|nr:uroporphyrinogen decarboxylase [Thermoleophilia bacterium]HQG54578.1 uroporphyrinogen decarboxylase [Thermoleophilia bacterium]